MIIIMGQKKFDYQGFVAVEWIDY